MQTLCEYKTGCFGCCGRNYTTKKEIKKDIAENSKDLKTNKLPLIEFRSRNNNTFLKPSGVCQNVIIQKGKCFCPLHPKRNKKDLRVGYCNTEYWCKTMQHFTEWNSKTKKAFMNFINKKDLDVYRYSIQIDNDTLLKEFLEHDL